MKKRRDERLSHVLRTMLCGALSAVLALGGVPAPALAEAAGEAPAEGTLAGPEPGERPEAATGEGGGHGADSGQGEEPGQDAEPGSEASPALSAADDGVLYSGMNGTASWTIDSEGHMHMERGSLGLKSRFWGRRSKRTVPRARRSSPRPSTGCVQTSSIASQACSRIAPT